MIRPINTGLIAHPINWLTILLMVIIAGSIGHLALSYFGIEPQGGSTYGNTPAGQSPGQVASGAIDPQYAPLDSQAG